MSAPNRTNNGSIPNRQSLLSSYEFSQLSTSDGNHDTLQQQQQQQRDALPAAPSSLLSNALPPSLLDDPPTINTGSSNSLSETNSTSAITHNTGSSTMGPTSSLVPVALVPPRPRRLWNVQDTSLKPVPPYYPPMDPNCTAMVTDVSPSLVVVRISECLRKRSIAVEYDEESVTARCMTVDRVHFVIQLYRGSTSGGGGGSSGDTVSAAHVVLVECQRQSGSTTSFHAACRAVLQAAKGLETGNDERRIHCTNGMEFNALNGRDHLVKRRKLFHQPTVASNPAMATVAPMASSNYVPSSSFSAAEAALEAARDLVQKDRLECQQLGMERLVNLTSMHISGEAICMYVSRRLLLPDDDGDGPWLVDFLMHPEAEQAMQEVSAATLKGKGRKGDLPDSAATDAALIRSFLEASAAVTPSPKLTRTQSFSSYSSRALWRGRDADDEGMGLSGTHLSPDELRHEARMRALALRVLCNALGNLSEANELQEILLPKSSSAASPSSSKRKSRSSSLGGAGCGSSNNNNTGEGPSRLVQPPFLLSLVQDLQGAGRPPSVSETGYKLASVHEAALAVRCLRLLAGGSTDDDSDDDGDDAMGDGRNPDGDVVLTLPQSRVRDFLRSDAILERLELARSLGRATHSVLQHEAEKTYHRLSEDVRSC